MEKRIEQYTPHTLEIVRRTLDKLDELGEPKFYSVQVDGQTVVSRTNNPSELDRVRGFLFHNSTNLKLIFYKGFEGDALEEITYNLSTTQHGTNGLSGLGEIDERIKQAVNSERRNWEHELMKKELSDTKKELGEAEEHIESLENLIDELKSSKNKLGNIHVGEVVSVMVESFMRRNVDKIKKLPGGTALAGILSDNSSNSNSETQESTEASFEKVNEEESWWSDVESAFNEKELDCIKAIVAILAGDKSKITTVLSLLQPNTN